MTSSERAEQVLVRRVVTAVCVVALLTVPLVHFGLGAFESWISVAHLGAFVLAFAALGRTRVGLGTIVTVVGTILLLVTLGSMWATASGLAAGTGEGVGLGTGLLWLTAGLGPAVLLAAPLRRAVGAALGVLAVGVLTMAAGLGWQWGTLLRHPGVAQVLLSVVAVVATSAVVAWLAGRSADERHRALQERRAQARRTARLEADQARRAHLFGRTAAQLRMPMRALVAASGDLARASGFERETLLVRMESLAMEMRARVATEMDSLTPAAAAPTAAAPTADVPSAEGRLAPVAVALAVALVVGLDALRTLGLGAAAEPHVAAAGANRMVAVLFVASAVLAVLLPGRRGWWVTGAVLTVHPLALLVVADPAVRDSLLTPYLAAWRIAVLAAGMLALLAVVIDRRVRDRDALVEAAAAAAALEAELQRREERAERARAEATHELKNPLTVIKGAARTIRERGPALQAAQVTALQTSLHRAIERLDGRLAAMDAAAGGTVVARGATPVHAERPASAAAVLQAALVTAQAGLEAQVEVDLDVEDAWTEVAPTALEHVLENLLGNAAKHGDGERVVVRAAEVDGELLLTVANRGGALTPDEADHVFEPYWRATGTEGGVEGAGLGLAIVDRLVGEWGGRCWAEVADGWTTIGVSLPTADVVLAPTWQRLEDQLG